MSAKLDALRKLITPTTEEEARESMRAYEAEATPGFVPAENEICEREMKFSAVKDFFSPIAEEELRPVGKAQPARRGRGIARGRGPD